MQNKFNNIDDLLKNAFEGYSVQPSPGVWKRISAAIGFHGKGIYFVSIVAVVVITTTISLFIGQSDRNSVQQNVNSNANSQILTKTSEAAMAPADADRSPSENKLPITHTSQSAKQASKPNAIVEKEINIKPLKIEESHNLVDRKKPEPDQLVNPETKPINSFEIYPGLERLQRNEALASTVALMNNPYPIPTDRNYFRNIDLAFTDDYGKKLNLLFGVMVMPEWIFTDTEKNNINFNLNTDLSIRYKKNDWYLESGIGLGITHNNGIFDVNYAQYDSIGYYYKVDQVTINETTGKPVLHTVTENVYDTLFYNQNINTRNSYTYLRIPLYAGIEVQSYRRLSVYLRAGITYNILISSNEKQAEFENSNATWIEINDQTPQRIQSNFALSGGLGFNYRLSRNVLLVAEPTGSYWAKPVYQRIYSVKSPWALGLRTGIIFKFGKP